MNLRLRLAAWLRYCASRLEPADPLAGVPIYLEPYSVDRFVGSLLEVPDTTMNSQEDPCLNVS